ncbi:hypothetical protein BsIDN1_22100 [Bacillus safensis]|uniref:Uncharacterized protein n=1 Tax=Bacillus safensis TaxID=561879 RepID=A0A5S9M7L9_BACIA|nr:hypothetical protein BsIDN1_22100 [Bacillus safensis]
MTGNRIILKLLPSKKKGLDKMTENNEDIKPRLFFSLSWTLFKSDKTKEALEYIAKRNKKCNSRKQSVL